MKNVIEKLICYESPLKGYEIAKMLEGKKEIYTKEKYPELFEDINKAIEILKYECFYNLKRSRKYWNKIISERI